MDRKLAEEAMKIIGQATKPLTDLDNLSMQIEDKSEQLAFRQLLAPAMMAFGYDMVAHICRQYPDLDPDKPKN